MDGRNEADVVGNVVLLKALDNPKGVCMNSYIFIVCCSLLKCL